MGDEFLAKFSNQSFRYSDELFSGVADGTILVTLSPRPDSSQTCAEYSNIYRVRSKRARKKNDPYWSEIADAGQAVCEALDSSPNEVCDLWSFDSSVYHYIAFAIRE